MLAMFVAAMDSSVVSTAVPTIAGELGHFSLYPWLIAGYLLTSTTTVPLWGRLADVHGRRRVLLAGLGWFLAASILCGLAPDMTWLVVLLSAFLLLGHRDAPPAGDRGRLDYVGAVTLTAGIGLLLLGLDGGGAGRGPAWPLVGPGLLGLVAFGLAQRRA